MPSAILRLCSSIVVAVLCAGLGSLRASAQQSAQPAVQQTGRIAGSVIDGATGRPIVGVSIEVVGTTVRVITDVEGRFRTALIPAGVLAVQATMLSYATTRVDSVRVSANQVATVQIVMRPAAVQLEAVSVTVTGHRQSSAAGLLAVQKNAAGVTDGISAEQMARSPDSDAAEAMARVTGVSVVDNKFVVVRGLAERYSNTLLNGVEIASPEPSRRIVPLDIFPAGLLESIVTRKTATPDMPGDFAGGSVHIQTKDFPERRVFEFKVTQGSNSEVTGKSLPVLPRHGFLDMLGFDNNQRTRSPAGLPNTLDAYNRFAETLRTRWTPEPHQVYPDIGLSLHLGDQYGEFDHALGYIVSADYGFKTAFQSGDYFALVEPTNAAPQVEALTTEASTTADWGAVANVTLRLGPAHSIGIKNLITHEAEEYVMSQTAYDAETQGGFDPLLRRFQVRYVERDFLQSQLRGQHRFTWPLESALEWNLTLSRATRDEPENRSLVYAATGGTYRLTSSEANYFWFRFLDDRIYGGAADLSMPIGAWFGDADALFKAGVMLRQKKRDFDAFRFNLAPPIGPPPDGFGVLYLPPEQITQPENIGRNLRADPTATGSFPYLADDRVQTIYAMVDLPLPLGLRFVGGARLEQWKLSVVPGDSSIEFIFPRTTRNENDLLWSANLTMALSERMNLRFAGYRTVSRPDPREIARGDWGAVTGKCSTTGNAALNRAQILSGDARWEWYPAPGELVSVSGFYKYFVDPFVEVVSIASLECIITPYNARNANNLGGELEIRKGLGFLASALDNFSIGVNFTYVDGSADLISENGISQLDLPLQDQSKYLINGILFYGNESGDLSASLLYNYFDDRVTLYGVFAAGAGKQPDVVEHGRGTLDFKVSKRFRHVLASLSGKNLTNAVVQESQLTSHGPILSGLSRPGVSFSLSIGYAF
jgi:hypothetical protein